MAIYTEKQLSLINAGLKAVAGRDYIRDNGSLYKGQTDGSLLFITDNFNTKAQDAVGGILMDSDSSTLKYNPLIPSITPNLTDTNVVAGTYGDVSNIPQIEVDEQGRVISAENVPVAADFITSISDTITVELDVSMGALSANIKNPSYIEKTSTYTIVASDYTINCTSGTFTVTLLTAIGRTGKIFIIKNSGMGTITLGTTSSQTIDGSTTQTILAAAVLQVQSTGSGWIIIN